MYVRRVELADFRSYERVAVDLEPGVSVLVGQNGMGKTNLIEALSLFSAGRECGADANMAKMLASEASWAAADMCLQTHGGFGFAEAYDIERKFRETRLYQVAPISTNLILSHVATHVLGLPKSF